MPRPSASRQARFVPGVALDPEASVPLWRQLYRWFRQAILDGRLAPGQRLPSTRALAADLGISRIPVLSAYDQLAAEGFLESSIGSGTVVARSIRQTGSLPVPSAGTRRLSREGSRLASLPDQPWLRSLSAFRVSLPALDHFPSRVWSRLLARQTRRPAHELLAYGDPMGYLPLREAIAEYLATVRGVQCRSEQVMVVTGSQQALQLAARMLLDQGDRVWMEEPGYPGARQALETFGAKLIPVPVDAEGLNPEEGIRRSPKARAVYVTPSHQYPLGATLSAGRRLRLLEWARQNGAWILEDDYDSEYRFDSRPVASLQSLDPDSRVIYIGTFSKVVFPALRVGYMVLPRDIAPAVAQARDASDIFSATPVQAALTDFIREGHFARHIRRMRALYAGRRAALLHALDREFGGQYPVLSADAGMHLVLLLPDGMSDVEAARRAAEQGVSAMPLSGCCAGRPARRGLILGYAGVDEVQIRAGVGRLAVALRTARSQG